MRIASQSKEYVRVEVQTMNAGVVVNPTGDTVEMSFPASEADPSAWVSATWETDATSSPTRYYARALVGPGTASALAEGLYDVWVRVTDSPEIPVKRAGKLEVF